MNPTLVIYKASAGSGKTFKLAVEYIKLLVKNPQAYRQTLAVTFTNKATEEMKTRILSQLYGIWRGLPGSKAYLDVVCKELGATPEFVASQAEKALKNLLHNYNYFRIETIDSFFQSVLRNLARELDLTANLRIGLNDGQVEEMAVDQLIESLSAQDMMLQWLLNYIMDNISDDRTWNVIGQIKNFGKTIFKEFYKQESKQLKATLQQKDFFDDYTTLLKKERSKAKERMQKYAIDFFETLEAEGLSVDDLSYGKSGVASFFYKIQNGQFDEASIGKRATDALGQPEKWCKKTHQRKDVIYQLADNELGDILRRALEDQPRQWRIYKSADLTLKHLSQLRLLESIEAKVRELNVDANRFLLSDTQQLLHDLIEDSDSPFIYEKIGTQLEHIMIDEFQDTSTVQWKNFKTLLEETMSHEDSENLIVGDVKQSIYRWRSGDWRLLAGIKDQFSNAERRLRVDTLSTNYRSKKNIVDFNNAFFTKAAEVEGVTAYDGVCQEVKSDRIEGYVEIRLLPDRDYRQQTLDELATTVNALLDSGAKASDIAILLRVNANIPVIANYFMEKMPQIKIISDEAFRLDSSLAVNTIIQALRYINTPEDAIAEAYLAQIFQSESPLHRKKPAEALPQGFKDNLEALRRMPLYELTEKLYAIFRLDRMKGQSAYLCAFYDQIATFVNDNAAGINAFLREWDANLCGKTIQSPELDGIRLISIHKSKGLEFTHVLLPFCDWRLEMNDVLWCKPREAPFNLLPIVPVDYSEKGMKGTVYERDYQEEHEQIVVDNLNLLYVAFTRAANNLYVWGKRKTPNSRSALIEAVLPDIVDQLHGASLSGDTNVEEPLVLSFGSLSMPTEDKKFDHQEDNVFLRESIPVDINLQIFQTKVEFRQSNKSQQFVNTTDEAEESKTNYIQLGSVLHQVFSTIRTTKDIDKALQNLELEGIIYDKQLTRERLENLIRKRLSAPGVSRWFDPQAGWTLYNECTILLPDAQERRPDRVMTNGKETIIVDFKFGREQAVYHEQVHEYMDLVRQLGLPNVKGYLWFVYSNQIVEVK